MNSTDENIAAEGKAEWEALEKRQKEERERAKQEEEEREKEKGNGNGKDGKNGKEKRVLIYDETATGLTPTAPPVKSEEDAAKAAPTVIKPVVPGQAVGVVSVGGGLILPNPLQPVELTEEEAMARRVDAEYLRRHDEKEKDKQWMEMSVEEKKTEIEKIRKDRKLSSLHSYSGWERYWRPRRLQTVMHVKGMLDIYINYSSSI